MIYKIWDKEEDINGSSAEYVIKSFNIKKNDEVFLVLNNSIVIEIQIKSTICSIYSLDINLTCEEVARKYLEIKLEEQEKSQQEKLTLEEATNKISILEGENAELLLDSAIKDLRIQTTENDIADLTLEIAMMGGI